MPYFFVRVNGETAHNNPASIDCYVPNEPPNFPTTYFNYYQYCLDNNIIRIGWPDVGDILAGAKYGVLANCYDLAALNSSLQEYLRSFSRITLENVILMPNKDNPGELYIGEVIEPYCYYHNIPKDPYECSHRLGVNWDIDKDSNPIVYSANTLGINIHGGWWMWGFYEIQDIRIINNIDHAR